MDDPSESPLNKELLQQKLCQRLLALHHAYAQKKEHYVAELDGTAQNGLHTVLSVWKSTFDSYLLHCGLAKAANSDSTSRAKIRVTVNVRIFNNVLARLASPLKLERKQIDGSKLYILKLGINNQSQNDQTEVQRCRKLVPTTHQSQRRELDQWKTHVRSCSRLFRSQSGHLTARSTKQQDADSGNSVHTPEKGDGSKRGAPARTLSRAEATPSQPEITPTTPTTGSFSAIDAQPSNTSNVHGISQ